MEKLTGRERDLLTDMVYSQILEEDGDQFHELVRLYWKVSGQSVADRLNKELAREAEQAYSRSQSA